MSKSRDVIDAAMSDWHTVDAPAMAAELFEQLDEAERDRLALRGFTSDIRAALRVKDSDGVPRYASLRETTAAGTDIRRYKRTALFTAQDFAGVIEAHQSEARAHMFTAVALDRRCAQVHGTQRRFAVDPARDVSERSA